MNLVAKEASKQVEEGGTAVAAEQTDLKVRPDCACAIAWFDYTQMYSGARLRSSFCWV